MNTQYSDTSTDSDSSSYGCEEIGLPPIMGTEKPMELIELPNSDAASVDTPPPPCYGSPKFNKET